MRMEEGAVERSVQRCKSAYGLCKSAKVSAGEVYEGTWGRLQKAKGGRGPEETEGRVEG
jgi:hypothetical protein